MIGGDKMKAKSVGISPNINSKLNRDLITRFGSSVYLCPEVNKVSIKVSFRDGSSINFKRNDEEDWNAIEGED